MSRHHVTLMITRHGPGGQPHCELVAFAKLFTELFTYLRAQLRGTHRPDWASWLPRPVNGGRILGSDPHLVIVTGAYRHKPGTADEASIIV
jgi:hypothetical protein